MEGYRKYDKLAPAYLEGLRNPDGSFTLSSFKSGAKPIHPYYMAGVAPGGASGEVCCTGVTYKIYPLSRYLGHTRLKGDAKAYLNPETDKPYVTVPVSERDKLPPDLVNPETRAQTMDEYLDQYEASFGRKPGPYFNMKKGNDPSMSDLDQFSIGDYLWATVTQGDIAQAGDVVSEGGRYVTRLDGGINGAMVGDRAGEYGWASRGEGADTLLRQNAAKTGGLVLIMGGAKEQPLTSTLGSLVWDAEIGDVIQAAIEGKIEGGVEVEAKLLDYVQTVFVRQGHKQPASFSQAQADLDKMSFNARGKINKAFGGANGVKLGLPSTDIVAAKMADPDLRWNEFGELSGFVYIDPSMNSVTAEEAEIYGNKAYGYVNRGMGFGTASKRVHIADLAEDYPEWEDAQKNLKKYGTV